MYKKKVYIVWSLVLLWVSMGSAYLCYLSPKFGFLEAWFGILSIAFLLVGIGCLIANIME